jgi:hypothetical protein
MGFISEIPNVSSSCSFKPVACRCVVFSCIHELHKIFILLVVGRSFFSREQIRDWEFVTLIWSDHQVVPKLVYDVISYINFLIGTSLTSGIMARILANLFRHTRSEFSKMFGTKHCHIWPPYSPTLTLEPTNIHESAIKFWADFGAQQCFL